MIFNDAVREWEKKHQVGLTTEQLGEALLRTIQQMTPKEKAAVRAELKKAFASKPASKERVN